jgi:hypothetical protein
MLALWTTPLAGQAFGVPVSGAGFARGVTLHAAAGFPNSAAEGGAAGMIGVSLGARRVGLTGFLSGRVDRARVRESFWGGGAAASVKLFGGPLVPFLVQLQGGVAYAAVGSGSPGGSGDGGLEERFWHVPVGLGLSWVFAQPVVAVKPWIAPRLDYSRSTGPDPLADPMPGQPVPRVTTGATRFGLSGGVSFGFLNGLALELAYDRVFAGAGSPASLGVGLSYVVR